MSLYFRNLFQGGEKFNEILMGEEQSQSYSMYEFPAFHYSTISPMVCNLSPCNLKERQQEVLFPIGLFQIGKY